MQDQTQPDADTSTNSTAIAQSFKKLEVEATIKVTVFWEDIMTQYGSVKAKTLLQSHFF